MPVGKLGGRLKMRVTAGRTVVFSILLAVLTVAFVLPALDAEGGFRGRRSQTTYIVQVDDIMAEINFGRELAATVLGRYRLEDDDALNRYVSLVGRSVARHANRPELEFKFGVLKTDAINAYAMPGGYVMVTKGALLQMQDEAELAGVLAHEIAHITGKHIVKELDIKASDDSTSASFARFAGGKGDPAKAAFLNLVDQASSILFERGYAIEDEKSADSDGTIFLAISGYDPMALSRFLDRIRIIKGEKMDVLNKTHPSFADRINLISDTITTEGLNFDDAKLNKERFAGYKNRI